MRFGLALLNMDDKEIKKNVPLFAVLLLLLNVDTAGYE